MFKLINIKLFLYFDKTFSVLINSIIFLIFFSLEKTSAGIIFTIRQHKKDSSIKTRKGNEIMAKPKQHSSISYRKRNLLRFTLIELLIVIAIIAILAVNR